MSQHGSRTGGRPTEDVNDASVEPVRPSPVASTGLLSLKGWGIVFVGTQGGEIPPGSRAGAGLYAFDTRHLSLYRLRVRGIRLRLRAVRLLHDGARFDYVASGSRTLVVSRRLRIGTALHDRWSLRNAGSRPLALTAELSVAADFRDLLEVRSRRRVTGGRITRPRGGPGALHLAYTAADGVEHRTELASPGMSWRVVGTAAHGRRSLRLPPGESVGLTVAVRARSTGHAPTRRGMRWDEWLARTTRFTSDPPELGAWLARSSADLFMLCEPTEDGPFPMAGSPWFIAPFGRDSLITAMCALPVFPELAPTVLRYLARTQGQVEDAATEEEPGRIAHEIRQGELARTGSGPGTPYYGSVDATPLFVWLAAEAARWLPEADLVRALEPQLRGALRWMEERGDRDGDGFIEYERRAPHGLDVQVWKDSHDSLLTRGRLRPNGPVAAVEVQAYAYAARASLAEVVAPRDAAWARELAAGAAALRQRFERAFWMEDRDCYGQALVGRKRLVRDIVSNSGHVLWAGAASARRGRRAAERLREPDLASGWGIRTRSARSAYYDPASYHNGSVWAHDTAIAAAGMRRYGARAQCEATIAELLAAAASFPSFRVPELFGGQPRRPGVPPVAYPVACSPQAWTAAAAFLCARAMLGLEVSPDGSTVSLDALLPRDVRRFEAMGLRIGGGTLDVRVERRGRGAMITDLSARGIRVVERGPSAD